MRILAKPGIEIGELNPYTKILYQHIRNLGHTVVEFSFFRALTGKYDILHFHWPEYYVANTNSTKAILGTLGTLVVVAWARMRGTKIVWTSHNLESHVGPRPRAERWFWNAFSKSLDAFIALTPSGRVEANRIFPHLQKVPSFVIPHGNYRGEYLSTADKRAARSFLGILLCAKVICFFGAVSKYKGVPNLVSAFRKMPDSNLILLIAGAADNPEEVKFLESQAREDKRIKLCLTFIPKDQVQSYLGAADLVVLPFRKIWNSGSAMLALSFDRPILVPAQGAFVELQEQVGAQWVRLLDGELTTRQLEDALIWATDSARSISAPLGQFEWQGIANDTVRAYFGLIDNRHPQDLSPRLQVPSERAD